MKYGDADANLQTQVKECMKFTETLITELEVKRQRDEAEKKLSSTQVTLKEALDEVKLGMTLILATQNEVSSLQHWFESTVFDYNKILDKNAALSAVLASLQSKLSETLLFDNLLLMPE